DGRVRKKKPMHNFSEKVNFIWSVAQGNCILCGEHFAKVVLTPTRFEALGFGAAFGSALVLEQIQGHVPQDSEVLWAVILVHATVIFVKSNIEHPVDAIFNPPMSAHRSCKGLGLACQTHEVVACFLGDLLPN